MNFQFSQIKENTHLILFSFGIFFFKHFDCHPNKTEREPSIGKNQGVYLTSH
jgi:hypothetical protein